MSFSINKISKIRYLMRVWVVLALLFLIAFNSLKAAELVSGLRVGYEHFAGVDLQYATPVSDGRVGILHKGWNDLRNNIYLSGILPKLLVCWARLEREVWIEPVQDQSAEDDSGGINRKKRQSYLGQNR